MQAVVNPKSAKHTKILSIREIAWWWLGDSMIDHLQDGEGYVWTDLPVIQRGFVWHANKIERLWDSIATGFPIGALMLQRQTKDKSQEGELLSYIPPAESKANFYRQLASQVTTVAARLKRPVLQKVGAVQADPSGPPNAAR